MSDLVSLPRESKTTSPPVISMDYAGKIDTILIDITLGTKMLVDIREIEKVAEYELQWPLRVHLYKTKDLIFAEEQEFGLWSDGEDIEEAIEGLKAFFKHEYLGYLETPEEEMDLLARQEKAKFLAWVK